MKADDFRSLSNKSPSNQAPCRGESIKDYENSAVALQNPNQLTETNN